MTKELAQKLLDNYDGDHSNLYPLIKNEIEKMDYKDHDLPFPECFLFFEDDYLKYYLDILEKGIDNKKIFDIGCQYGFQSFVFEDMDYTGIDHGISDRLFFRNNGNYITKSFPCSEIDLKYAIVISNMSLGYFNEPSNLNDCEIAKALSPCSYLYIGTTHTLLEELDKYFYESIVFEDGGFPKKLLINKKICKNSYIQKFDNEEVIEDELGNITGSRISCVDRYTFCNKTNDLCDTDVCPKIKGDVI